jgi:hypothetical protein
MGLSRNESAIRTNAFKPNWSQLGVLRRGKDWSGRMVLFAAR